MVSRAFIKRKIVQIKDDLYNTGQANINDITMRQILEVFEDMENKLMEQKKEITKLRNMVGE